MLDHGSIAQENKDTTIMSFGRQRDQMCRWKGLPRTSLKVGISDVAIERDRKIRMKVENKRPNEKLRKTVARGNSLLSSANII
jgi:hypothetical protein